MVKQRLILFLTIISCFLLLMSCQSNNKPSVSNKRTHVTQENNQNKGSLKPSTNINGNQQTSDNNISWYPRPHIFQIQQMWGKNVIDSVFIDSMNGWMIARQEQGKFSADVDIFRTNDSGTSWNKIAMSDESVKLPDKDGNTPSGTLPFGYEINWISFLDSNTGWISGSIMYGKLNSPCIYVTHDGGYTWKNEKLNLPESVKNWIDNSTEIFSMPVQFFTPSDGFVELSFEKGDIKWEYLYITHDSGNSWNEIYDITESGNWAGKSMNMSWDFTSPEKAKVIIGNDIWLADSYRINWTKQSN